MKNKLTKLILIITTIISMYYITSINLSFAYDYELEETKPGLKNIQPGDSLNFPNNTRNVTLTAVWGVEVKFIDYDERIIKSETIKVSNSEKGNTITPENPVRKNYKFISWKRYDENGGLAYLNDNIVTDIQGPGPIIFIANYEKIDDKYKVTYSMEDDTKWGAPDESISLYDNNSYVYNDSVKVLINNNSLKGYAIDSVNGRKVAGTWNFNINDKDNPELNDENMFLIKNNTEIKGNWIFEPDKLTLTYNVIKDTSWGEPEDSDIISQENEYEYNDKVKVARSISPYKSTALDEENGRKVPGTWVYDIKENVELDYNEEGEFNIFENTIINGVWKFTPDKVRVTYVTKTDNIWGEPKNEEVPIDYNLYNYKDNINIINNTNPIKGVAKNLNTGKMVSGTWTLAIDDIDSIALEDVTIDAQWVFNPNPEVPKTGDNILLYVLLAILSFSAVIIFTKKIFVVFTKNK